LLNTVVTLIVTATARLRVRMP